MSKTPSAALARKIKIDKPVVPEDKLEAVRDQLRKSRDTELEIADLEKRLADRKSEQNKRVFEELPAMFQEIGIDRLGIEADGNLPAYDAALSPYYKASIPSDWPQEKQDEAFGWLENEGYGDLVKNTFLVQLGRGDEKRALKLRALLEKAGYEFENKRAVPWNTLTSFVKEQVEKHNTTPPLELLGATVGKIVKLKPRKEK